VLGNEGKNTRKKKGPKERRNEVSVSKEEGTRQMKRRGRKIIEIVEERRTITRRCKVTAETSRGKEDTRGMKPRLGIESNAAAKKFM